MTAYQKTLSVLNTIQLTMRIQLPCSPFPSEGEGLLGYRLRLTELNHYKDPTWIYAGAIAKTLQNGAKAGFKSDVIKRLSELTKYNPEDLECALLFPVPVAGRFLNTKYPRVCPSCLQDHQTAQAIWEISLMVACPFHGNLLLHVCPRCERPLTWSRSHVSQCNCGYDFRCAVTEAADKSVVNLMRWIVRASQGATISHGHQQLALNIQDSFPSQDLSLTDLSLSILFVGGVCAHRRLGIPFMKPSLIRFMNALAIVKHAANALQNWPMSLHAALREVEIDRAQEAQTGLGQTFGFMYKYLFKELRSHDLHYLREQFEAYLKANWVGLLDNKRLKLLSMDTRTSGRYVSTIVARRTFKLRVTHFRRLVESGTLPGRIRRFRSGRVLVLIDREGLARAAEIQRDTITLKDASWLLGLKKRRFLELLNSEVLRGHKTIDPFAGYPLRSWQIRKSDVIKLLSALRSGLMPIREPIDRSKCISIARLIQYHLGMSGAFPALITALRDGHLKALGYMRGARGISGILLDRKEVLGFLLKHQLREGFFTSEGAAKKLGLSRVAVYSFAEHGLLRCKKKRFANRPAYVVSSKELERFHNKFVTLSELSRKLRLNYKETSRTLKRSRIKPVTGPTIDGSEQYLFLRRHAMKLLLSAGVNDLRPFQPPCQNDPR